MPYAGEEMRGEVDMSRWQNANSSIGSDPKETIIATYGGRSLYALVIGL